MIGLVATFSFVVAVIDRIATVQSAALPGRRPVLL